MTSLYENHQFIVPLMMKLNSKFSFSNFYHHLGCLTYTFPMSSDHGRSKLQNAYNELRFDFWTALTVHKSFVFRLLIFKQHC